MKITALLLGSVVMLSACAGLMPRGNAPAPAPTPAPTLPSRPTTQAPGPVSPAPTPPTAQRPSAPTPQPGAPVPAPSAGGTGSSQGGVGVIPDRPINIAGNCAQTEEDGYKEQATLNVKDNQVQSMSWQLWVGKKGSCKFDLADYVQTKARPSIELASKDGSACKLVIYQDPRRITLGFANCQRKCTGNVYDEAYPIMFDPRTGGCANLNP